MNTDSKSFHTNDLPSPSNTQSGEMVVLQFTKQDATRLEEQESSAKIGHYRVQTQSKEVGNAVWSAWVIDWRPLLPWILSWGADVEVLAPADLREAVYEELRALAQRYGWFLSRAPGVPATLPDGILADK